MSLVRGAVHHLLTWPDSVVLLDGLWKKTHKSLCNQKDLILYAH